MDCLATKHHSNTYNLKEGVNAVRAVVNWVDSFKDAATREISDQIFANAANHFLHNIPTTKEGYRYCMIFEELFPARLLMVLAGKRSECERFIRTRVRSSILHVSLTLSICHILGES